MLGRKQTFPSLLQKECTQVDDTLECSKLVSQLCKLGVGVRRSSGFLKIHFIKGIPVELFPLGLTLTYKSKVDCQPRQ